MKIPELVYEIRNLARKEEDPSKKDLFYQCAKAMEILGNVAKVGDLIVAEHNAATSPAVNTDAEIKWNIDDESLKMMEEHIEALVHYGFMEQNDRWPYDNADIKLFVSKYLKSQSVNDSSIE
jgi:hypothetical protein